MTAVVFLSALGLPLSAEAVVTGVLFAEGAGPADAVCGSRFLHASSGSAWMTRQVREFAGARHLSQSLPADLDTIDERPY